MVVFYNWVLILEQIQINFDVGVGQKFYMLFGVLYLINVLESYIVFEVSQFDSYSYWFISFFFISLDNSVEFLGICLRGMCFGINGKELVVGQVWVNLDVILNSNDYESGMG